MQQISNRESAREGEGASGQTAGWFTDREIFLRGGGRLRYLSLSRNRQLTFAVLAGGLAVWIVCVTAAAGYLGLERLNARREIEDQKRAYISLLADIGQYHQEFSRIIGEFEGNQSLLLSHLAESEGAADTAGAANAANIDAPRDATPSLERIRDQLTDTRVDKARMVVLRDALAARLESFESELQQLAARDASQRERLTAALETLQQSQAQGAEVAEARALLDEELSRVEAERDRLAAEKTELERSFAATRKDLEAAELENAALARQSTAFHAEVESLYGEVGAVPEREAQFRSQIVKLESDLEEARNETASLEAQRDFQQARADKMEKRLDEVSEIQSAVVARLGRRTMAGIDMIERIVAMTGLNVNELIATTGVENLALDQGGPYIDVAGDYLITDDPNAEFQSSVFVLNQQLDRWEALQEVIRSIPLSSPLDQYRVSSGFGERVDPVNGRKAIHYGIDLKAPLKTPIMATAPGTVVFAGWRGAYGRVVEIDHGSGIHTRYAHLRQALVKKGDTVAYRQEIALLGTSGRSTGAHVHYEILVDGQPRDPALFVMAGRNAFKE